MAGGEFSGGTGSLSAVAECCCRTSHFTDREVEVLAQVAVGRITSQIADQLSISKRTVEAHLASMLRRAGAHTRAELVAVSYVSGIFKSSMWPPEPSGKTCLVITGGLDESDERNIIDHCCPLGSGIRPLAT